MIGLVKELFASFVYPQYLKTYIIYCVIIIVSHIFIAMAVHYHAKINYIKYGNLWTSAAFFLSFLVVAIYFWHYKRFKQEVPIVCSKCGKKPPRGRTKCPHCGNTHFAPAQYENADAIRNKIIVFVAIGVVLSGFGYWFFNYSPMAVPEDAQVAVSETEEDFVHYDYDGIYYDMKGKDYLDNYEVPYYDRDGNEYIYEAVEGLVRNDGSGEAIPFNLALVDDEGYLVVNQFDTVPEIVPFKTQDGTMYYWAKDVSWTSNGSMIYSSNGEKIVK